jgi:hypothetical protein
VTYAAAASEPEVDTVESDAPGRHVFGATELVDESMHGEVMIVDDRDDWLVSAGSSRSRTVIVDEVEQF